MKNPAIGDEGSPIYGGPAPVLGPGATFSLYFACELPVGLQDPLWIFAATFQVQQLEVCGGASQFWGGIIASEAGHGFSTGMQRRQNSFGGSGGGAFGADPGAGLAALCSAEYP